MRKGFTLIELLAVIVILAIIALIATPIILEIINNTKEESNKRSVEMYGKAVENAVAQSQLNGIVVSPDIYSTPTLPIKVEYDGNVECGTVEINKDGSVYIEDCIIDGQEIEYSYGIEGDHHLSKVNVKASTEETKTTGTVPTTDSNGNIVPGSEFEIKVNNTSKYLPFFVLSNSEDGKYVNLIAEQNITILGEFTSETQNDNRWYITSSDNRYGPQTAYTYLSNATSSWTNIPIIENFNYLDEGHIELASFGYQSLVTKLDSSTGKYITTITPHSSNYGNPVTYENLRARLPYVSEVIENTNCSIYSSENDYKTCQLWLVNYLYSNDYYSEEDGKINSKQRNYGYWTLSSYKGYNGFYSQIISFNGCVNYIATNSSAYGVRPVITVVKSDLLRVM